MDLGAWVVCFLILSGGIFVFRVGAVLLFKGALSCSLVKKNSTLCNPREKLLEGSCVLWMYFGFIHGTYTLEKSQSLIVNFELSTLNDADPSDPFIFLDAM